MSLMNGGHYAGCTTATLTVSNADSNDEANFRCVVTGGCGNATSNEASLTVGAPAIPGDFDHDGDVDLADFGFLQACLDAGDQGPSVVDCEEADLGGDLFF